MLKVMHVLFLSCLKATELIEKRSHFQLSFIESIQLRFHKMMCEACRMYESHSYFIDLKMNRSQKLNGLKTDLERFKEQLKKQGV